VKEFDAATADAWEDASDGPALGRDPFEEVTVVDPFVARLERAALGPVRARRAPRLQAVAPAARPLPAREPPREAPRPLARVPERPAIPLRRRRATSPALAEVELPETRGLLDRLMGEDERRRLAALCHLVDGET
jgi:hypothetical protein